MLKKPAPISPILKALTHNFGLKKDMQVMALKKDWSHLVGETIALHTSPEKLKFKTLTLRVDGPTWKHELTFLKAELIEKINRQLGKTSIQTLILKVGSISPQSPLISQEKKRVPKELSKEEVTFIQEQLSSVLDEGLKKTIHKAMSRHIRVKRQVKRFDESTDGVS